MKKNDVMNGIIGHVEISTVPIDKNLVIENGTYTCSGRILLTYKREGDSKDFHRLATLNDDGSDFRCVFNGEIPEKEGSNGIRYMCFSDNKRILLGDYVLECEPDLDHADSSQLLPIVYPPKAPDAPSYTMRWSEVVVSPDSEYIAWTVLLGAAGSVNLLGRLVRKDDSYRIESVRNIYTDNLFMPDEDNPGCVRTGNIRGGEIKQFIRGGKSLSVVGMGFHTRIADSVVQDLDGEGVRQITHTPCYDETTIFSPDEKLGIVMSTRFSPKTNCAVLGLVDRPHARISLSGLTLPIYLYSIASVRKGGTGNVGPALVEIERCADEGYMGVDLSDKGGEWVYVSPMSWHPESKRAMWNERIRGGVKQRVRIAYLPDYIPSRIVQPSKVPDNIPYAKEVSYIKPVKKSELAEMKIMGKVSGCFTSETDGKKKVYKYVNYSDDGATVFDGTETFVRHSAGCVYTAKLVSKGASEGEMDLRLAFSQPDLWESATIDFSPADDGKCSSYGFARCNGKELFVEDMEGRQKE